VAWRAKQKTQEGYTSWAWFKLSGQFGEIRLA